MKLGSCIFAPRPITTGLTLVMIIVLLSLGRWQLRRADEKRVLFDAFDRGSDSTRSIDVETPTVSRYQHVEAYGRYDQSRQILIDNMTDSNGRAGYFVLTPFALAGGGWLLVNRGWVPVGMNRGERPNITVPDGDRHIRGRANQLPSPGIRMGHPAALQPPFPVVANFPSHGDIEELLHEPSWARATEVLQLDPGEPDGYVRQWQAPGMPPMRHIGYAVQWFGLALALAVIYVVTNVRRASAASLP